MINNNDTSVLKELFKTGQADSGNIQIIKSSFNVLGVFIVAVDIDGRILFINNRGCEVLEIPGHSGYSGCNFTDTLVDQNEKNKTQSKLNSFLSDSQIHDLELTYRFKTHSGNERIIRAQTIKITDNDNAAIGFLVTGKDLTENIKARESLEKNIDLYRVLLNSIPGLTIFVFNRDLQFILAEGTEIQKSGLSPQDIINKKLDEIPDKKLKKRWGILLPEVLDGKNIKTEYKLRNNYYHLIGLPLSFEEGKVITGLAVVRNITGERLSERILKKSRNDAVKEGKAKNRFLARVTHEIRTPLNAIMGFTEQLAATDLSYTQLKYVKIIDKSSELLLSLVNDILVLSKIEAGQISFEKNVFRLKKAIKYVFEALSSKANRKNIGFNYALDDKADRILRGDSFRLQQILMNMLNNAIKFTSKGEVRLICSAEQETERDITIKFDVIDTGTGISNKYLKDIFNQYKRGDEENEKTYEGTGIGLAICKNLIELQKGSLSVSSQKGAGTTFSFILTYEKANKEDLFSPTDEVADKEKLKDIRILMVDDDNLNLLLGKTILDKYECNYDIADSGSLAIEKINNNKYDLILLDIHMPETDGIKVARHLRKKLKDNRTRIIAMTAAALRDDIRKFEKSGIDDFIIKPFKEDYLFSKLCNVLGKGEIKTQTSKTEIILKKEISPKPYNLHELHKMAGSDTSFIIQTLNLFIDNSNQAIERFRYYLNEKNWEQIGETAHKLLPSYRHLEVHHVVRKLLSIKKKTLITNDSEGVESLVEKTIVEIEKILTELRKEIPGKN